MPQSSGLEEVVECGGEVMVWTQEEVPFVVLVVLWQVPEVVAVEQ